MLMNKNLGNGFNINIHFKDTNIYVEKYTIFFCSLIHFLYEIFPIAYQVKTKNSY